MKSFFALFVLLCLPPLAVIAHDLYFAYVNEESSQIIEKFRFSDTGWLWLTYSRDTFNEFRAMVGKEQWDLWIEPAMRTPAIAIASIPLGLLLVVELVVRIVSALASQIFIPSQPRRRHDFTPSESRDKQQRYKYKRK